MLNDKTAWFAFLHSLADIIRNGKSKFTGHDALNEMNNLLLLRFIQPRIGKYDKDKFIPNNNTSEFSLYSDDPKNKNGLDEECMFEYIYNKYCINYDKIKSEERTNINNEIFELLYGQERQYTKTEEIDNEGCSIGYKMELNGIKKSIFLRLLFSEDVGLGKMFDNDFDMNQFIHKITGFTSKHVPDIVNLIKKIYIDLKDIDFSKFNYDGFGDAYEKYKAEDAGNGKTFGQHFTRRDVIELIVNELKPKYNELCYDPACGTGGFLHGFDTYVKSEIKDDKDFNKKYKVFKKNIYGREIEAKIYKALMFNMMIHQIDMKNIEFMDSLSENNNNPEYDECIINKIDVIGANPPFGMSLKIDYNPNLYPIIVKNSVALFLQHILNALKDKGRAGIVIDRGILNNGNSKNAWEVKLRKHLMEKSNLYKIILLPTGIFAHTNFATAIIFFTKGEKTKEIEFIEGYFKDEDKGKGMKTMYLKEGKKISMDQIKEKNYNLKFADYFEQKVEENKEGWVKLGDIVELYKTTKHCTSLGKEEGKYRFYSSSQTDKLFIDKNEIDKESIIIGNGGCANVHYDIKYTPSKHVTSCFIKNDKYIAKYIYYYLRININVLEKEFSGGGLKWLNREKITNIKIPSISLPHQEKIVEFLDKIYKTYKIEDTVKYFGDKDIFNLLLEKKYEEFENIIWYQEQVPKLIYQLEQVPKLKNDYIKGIFNSVKCEKYKLGDIVEIQNLKSSKIEKADENGKYPFYNCSILGHLWTNEFVYDDEVLLINKTNGSGKYKVYYNNGKFNISGGLLIFKPIIKICKYKYLLNYINYNEHIFSKFYEGSDKKNINRESFLNYKINIPSIQDQEKIIKEIEKIESEQSSYAEYAKMLQTQIDSISKLITNITKTNNNIQENNIPEDTPEETPNNTPVETPDITPEEASEEEPEYETIEHEGKNYYLDGKKVYRINKDKSLGKYYGRYKNDKVIRASEEANKEEKKIVVKAKANVKAKE